jgi:DNA-binding NtrC family response regulator
MNAVAPRSSKSKPIRILCVEHGRDLARQVRGIYPPESIHLAYERTLQEVVDRFERETFDIMLFSSTAAFGVERDALDVLELISAKCPATQILFFVSPRQIQLARSALRAGSFHYAKLPITGEELHLLIDSALAQRSAIGVNQLLKKDAMGPIFQNLVGRSDAIKSVFRQIRQAALSDIPVLLTGETGTGKELVALAIHEESARHDRPYTPVHIGALPADLVPGELVGHEKGAFTGALHRKKGCFELSHGGTVFLDEISTIDAKMQITLLRLLETNTFTRIGGSQRVRTDVRVIAASNADLMELVSEGRFREDLFFRLDVMRIELPPLRDRHGDIPLLVDHFIDQSARQFQKPIRGLAPECLSRLENYRWPGNVRELKNTIQRAVVMCEKDILLPSHLPRRLLEQAPVKRQVTVPVGTTLREMERELIGRTLEYTNNSRTRAALMLGISRRALYNKLRRYNLSA